jgi:hypothetical protein
MVAVDAVDAAIAAIAIERTRIGLIEIVVTENIVEVHTWA